jgi:hypothetical protein
LFGLRKTSLVNFECGDRCSFFGLLAVSCTDFDSSSKYNPGLGTEYENLYATHPDFLGSGMGLATGNFVCAALHLSERKENSVLNFVLDTFDPQRLRFNKIHVQLVIRFRIL